MIHVIATIQTVPGKRADLLAEFHRIVPLVRAEVGCIEYGPAVDVDSGIEGLPAVRGDVVTVVERWENVAALKAHLVAAHMLRYREAVKTIVAAVDIRVLEPA
ncbi:MAG TPA: putative quinol monooxygenase [Lacipirellulaceae bacterium]|nr:putative quinol monooxygenase [Lacipirellulaceae bacterium]